MLQIDRAVVDALNRASSAEELTDLVQEAIRLEFSTIPPYLTAMLSLKPGYNREIWWDVHDVVVDEMLHMAIGCNLLNALGRAPTIADPGFLPSYPSPLPLGIGTGLIVGLLPFSRDLVRQVFMEIEEPENPIVFPAEGLTGAVGPSFATIGEFYRTLRDKLIELGDAVFSGDPVRQLMSPQWFPAERLFPITDVDSAVRALTLVVEEGEGTEIAPVDPDGDIAHYYRFEAIWRGRRLVADPTAPLGYSFTGPEYPFDPDGVWPLVANQRIDDLDTDTEAWRRVHQFQAIFTRLLTALQRVCDGEPERLDVAMGTMFELKIAGQVLVGLPAIVDGVATGSTAGPVFGYTLINE
jgi:hypothetical protein